jgi:hypothetical protein
LRIPIPVMSEVFHIGFGEQFDQSRHEE